MKKSIIILSLLAMFGCKPEKETRENNSPSTKTEIKKEKKAVKNKTKANYNTSSNNLVSKFLTDITTLENSEERNPIATFKELAENEASKVYTVSKNNIGEILTTAQQYKHCVITTKDHTIVKITDLKKCIQSGSWATCMPYANGYIKKGRLIPKEDYINNIIGIPDSQERKAYLFN